MWAEFFSDEITCGRLLFRENFAVDGLRVAGTDRKEMKLGLTENKFCLVFNGVWEWLLFKRYELAQGK